jgi:hypothetical protein
MGSFLFKVIEIKKDLKQIILSVEHITLKSKVIL